jgi:hypothetical protein
MKSRMLLAALATVVLSAVLVGDASAGEPKRQCRASATPWHGCYYHDEYAAPVALVVPPTASLQTHYRWGVGGTSISRIDHQFTRSWPGPVEGGWGFAPTPRWPSSTDQFGVYYVRAPWR